MPTGNPFNILAGLAHYATADQTPVSRAAYNKLQESLEGVLWAMEYAPRSVDRYVGDADPDFLTEDVDGNDRSGVDFDAGYMRAIAGSEFFQRTTGNAAADVTELRSLCKTNRPTVNEPQGRSRIVTGALTQQVSLADEDCQCFNSGLTLRNYTFRSSETDKRLDFRGLYDTNATTSLSGSDYLVTLSAGDLYDAHINVGDFVWIPGDTYNELTRVEAVNSSIQVKVSAQVATGSGKTVHILRGPLTFENCTFWATAWINNTWGVTFKNCTFIHDDGATTYDGGVLALGSNFAADDPGKLIAPKIVDCVFIQTVNSMTARKGPTGCFKSMVLMENAWMFNMSNNLWTRLATNSGSPTGVLVANGNGDGTHSGQGGVFMGNQEENPVSTYTTANRQTHLSGVFKVYDDLNMHGGAVL